MTVTWQWPFSLQHAKFCAITHYEGGASVSACGGRWATRETLVLIGVDVGALRCPGCVKALEPSAWTGPDDRDLKADGSLRWSVPGSRWPFGPPSSHEDCCNLRPQAGRSGGTYCDCKASDAGDRTHGEVSHTAPIERGLAELRNAVAVETVQAPMWSAEMFDLSEQDGEG